METAIRVRTDAARFEQAAALLPYDLRQAACKMPERDKARAEEFRLRAGRPPMVAGPAGEREIPHCPGPVRPEDLGLVLEVASRASAGIAVLCLRPMGSSQYAAMEGKKTGYVWWLAGLLLLSVALPLAATGSFAPLAAAVGYWLAAYYGYRQLNGMSGDISGFALTLGELAGVAVLTLAR